MHTVLDLGARFWEIDIAIAICVRDGDGGRGAVGKAKCLGRGREETGFDGFDGTVYDRIDSVDDIVNEGLDDGSADCRKESCYSRTRGV